MKTILLLLCSGIVMSCASRKKDLEKQIQETKVITEAQGQQNTNFQSQGEATTDFSRFLNDKTLKVTGNGQPYQLSFGGLVFSGSADVEFSDKKEETKVFTKKITNITYQTSTTYRTITTYKSILTDKKLKVERKAYPFWIFILVGFLGAHFFKFLWQKIKQSQWYLKIWMK